MLRKWEDLPDFMKSDEVREYYDILEKKKAGLFAKRVFDILFSAVLCLILAIPMVVLAVWIKLDSPGPVFYRQERVTTYGKHFRIHKFRTMVENADKVGTAVTVAGDSRITKVGAKLRDFRLEGNDIIRQTTKSLINKGFREVSPILFFNGCNQFSNDFREMIA